MGFYGNIINYITKGFKNIQIGNKIIVANTAEDTIKLTGENGITIEANTTDRSINFKIDADKIEAISFVDEGDGNIKLRK